MAKPWNFIRRRSSRPAGGRGGLTPGVGAIAILAGAVAGFFAYQGYGVIWPPLYAANIEGSWITSPGEPRHTSYFRKTFISDGAVRRVWVKIAADNEYSLYMNGQVIGSKGRAVFTAGPFQGEMSESGQKLGSEEPFPFVGKWGLQLASASEWKYASVHDGLEAVVPGENSIAVSVLSNRTPARLALEAEIENTAGEVIHLRTDSTWRAGELPEWRDGVAWHQTAFDDSGWPLAKTTLGSPTDDGVRIVPDPAIFRQAFLGKALTVAGGSPREAFFRTTVWVPGTPADGWLRISDVANYDLFVNGVRATSWFPTQAAAAPAQLHAYDIASLLRTGRNVLAVHVGPLFSRDQGDLFARLLLDGLVRLRDGRTIPIRSDGSWRASARMSPGWVSPGFADAAWTFAQVGDDPGRDFLRGAQIKYQATVLGTGWAYYGGAMAWMAGGAMVAMLLWGGMARWLRRRRGGGPGEAKRLVSICWLPAGVLLLLVLMLRLHLAESEARAYFYEPALWRFSLVGAATLMVAALAAAWALTHPGRSSGPLRDLRWPPLWGWHRVALAAILLVAAGLRLWGLGYQSYYVDEAASVAPAMGIAATGAPSYPTGVWYSRSPLYHYLLGLAMAILGESRAVSRLPSAVFGLLAVFMTYRFGRDIFRSRAVGLLAAFVVAVHPHELFFSRFARYYQQFQFFALLTVYLFIRGFVLADKRRLQILSMASFIGLMLSMEVGALLFPAFVAGYLVFGPPFRWRERSYLLVGVGLIGLVLFLDLLTFTVKTATPLLGVSENTRATLVLHFRQLPAFPLLYFVGAHRIHVLYSILFFIGFPYWLWRRDGVMIFLYGLVCLTLVFETILLPQPFDRYVFMLQVFLILVAVRTIVAFARDFPEWCLEPNPTPGVARVGRVMGIAVGTLTVAAFLVGVHPIRLVEAYTTKVIPDDSRASEFVRDHLQPGDRVIARFVRHAVVSMGSVDPKFAAYTFVDAISFEYYFRKAGIAVDRAGGAQLLANLDSLRRILDAHERVWIVMNDMLWLDYRQEFKDFIQANARAVYQSFYATVYLWERSAGRYEGSPGQGGERNLF